MPRPSYNQQVALVDFLEKNPSVMKGRLLSSSGKAENRKKWIKAAIHLNALGGAVKTGRGWAKYWAERKCSLKKLCVTRQKATCTDDGSPQKLSTLSELDSRIINILGGESFFLGDTFPVDPLQNTNVNPCEDISEASMCSLRLLYTGRVNDGETSGSSSGRLLEAEPTSTHALLSLSRSIEKMAASQEAMAKASENMSNACTLLATAIVNFSNNLP